MKKLPALCSSLFLSVLLGGCSTTHPVNYQGLASAGQLMANPKDKSGREPFRYVASDTAWPRYNAVILDPVTIYAGPDHQFGDLSENDKATLAAYAQTIFANALKAKFAAAEASPGPDTLRVHVTLTGAETNTPIIGTLSKLAPVGLVLNTVQTARNKQAALSGSVSYAVEVFDSTTNRLLRAYVAKQYPFAQNVLASFGKLDAARAGLRSGSVALVVQLQ